MAAREGRPQAEPFGEPGDMEERLDVQARLLAADEDAFRAVYERYVSLVLGVATRLTRDRAAAEDIAQEVFSYLWERPLAYDPHRGPLRAWLAVLAHHRSVDWIRREEKRRGLRAPYEPPKGDETADAAAEGMVALRVRALAAELPDTLRRPLLLAYYEGRTYRQVATELGIPEGTAKTRLRAALRLMAAALVAEGIAP
ncbi:sigma-70 family RNA polymerase sigma factor [Streptomyces sp. NPDC003077]|uniref:sigma-70 family RNA polymerase sigma factor n=1 Tax=Streptomyces sp. NPDC003077 TaxID=3154443 RepID=UPI0033BBFE3C